VKFAICNEIFEGWKLPEIFSYCAKLGYDGIEFAPFTLAETVFEITPANRADIRTLARDHGIEVCGLHWLLAKPAGLHLTAPDAAVRQKTRDYLEALATLCADLEGKIMVLGSPRQRAIAPEVSRAQAAVWLIECLQPALRVAEQAGVTICLEPLSPAETNFINTAAEAIELVRQGASPNLKIILDAKAMSSESKSIPQIISDSAPDFAHFHANDPNLKGPGFGALDFRPIAVALKQAGYDDYVSVEVFKFEEGPEEIARRSLGYLQEAFRPA
jgi:sugar phosphate isomerase/epimerase